MDRLAFRRDPAALPGWLAATTQWECGRVLRASRKQEALGRSPDAAESPDQVTGAAESELLKAEYHAALREAFAHLPPDDRQLITLLIQDPPVPHAEISARLGIPVESIGLSRGRCLAKLRRYPAIAAMMNAETPNAGAYVDVQPTAQN